MPVPKALRRAAREGGNIGESPRGDPLVAHTESVVENSKQPSGVGQLGASILAGVTKGLYVLEVQSAKLKENQRGPYRSVTGLAADGKLYWAGLPTECSPKKGDTITLKGEFKGNTFGKDGRYHKIEKPEVVGITDKPAARPMPGVEEALEPAKVSAPDAEGLQETLESLVKQHGIGKILSVLGEIT